MSFSNESKSHRILASMKTIKEGEVSTPYFIIRDKVNGEWVDKEKFKTFTATPYDIELGSYMWKNSPVDTVKLHLKDGIDNVQLEFNLDNGLSRSLLNTLLGEEKIGQIAMSLYVNGKGYPSIGIENNGSKTQWKYKFDEFPAVKKKAKGVVIDNADYIEFMKKMVMDIKAKLNKEEPKSADAPVKDSSNLPF